MGCIFQYDVKRTECEFYKKPMTNGDVIKVMFPNDSRGFLVVNIGRNDWWNTQYKREVENE